MWLYLACGRTAERSESCLLFFVVAVFSFQCFASFFVVSIHKLCTKCNFVYIQKCKCNTRRDLNDPFSLVNCTCHNLSHTDWPIDIRKSVLGENSKTHGIAFLFIVFLSYFFACSLLLLLLTWLKIWCARSVCVSYTLVVRQQNRDWEAQQTGM